MKFDTSVHALVTGGASGLGFAVAEKVVKAGGKVVMLDMNEQTGLAAVTKLGIQSHFLKVDVSDETQVDAAVAKAKDLMGSITLVVNCAGILGASRVLGREGPMSGAKFAQVVMVNLVGSFLVSKAAANLMQHNTPNEGGERGLIVNTASVAAFEGQIGQAAYSASKGGVISMALPMAREFARFGVRVMTIAPGIFWTPMMEGMPEDVQKSLGAQVPFPSRLGRPHEYADLVASIYENAMLNGECIRLDGAIRMQPK